MFVIPLVTVGGFMFLSKFASSWLYHYQPVSWMLASAPEITVFRGVNRVETKTINSGGGIYDIN